jgi:hypothetical protein
LIVSSREQIVHCDDECTFRTQQAADFDFEKVFRELAETVRPRVASKSRSLRLRGRTLASGVGTSIASSGGSSGFRLCLAVLIRAFALWIALIGPALAAV